MAKRTTILLTACLTTCSLTLIGCLGSEKGGTRVLKTSDFAGSSDSAPVTAPRENTRAQSDDDATMHVAETDSAADLDIKPISDDDPLAVTDTDKDAPVNNAASNPLPDRTYTADAMVGQVNGRPLYASRVLEPIEEQLAALGQRLPRSVFRERAQELVVRSLTQIIADALILGEATRDLSPQEEMGVLGYLKTYQDKLLRQWGRGSRAVAEARLLEKTGKTLEETIQEERQRQLIARYLRRKLYPQINVSRKDIERYYADHEKEFNPPAGRTLRVIRVKDEAAAKEIEQQLAQGKPFAEVAANSSNLYRSGDGGLMPEVATGETVFGQKPLNDAMLELAQGQHTPRVDIDGTAWWVYVETLSKGEGRSLMEVQLDIEHLLRAQQFQQLTQDYRAELFERGSYNSLNDMTYALVDVAMSRYALPE